ncbi:MAG TPA: MBL fold metallo-hydrolase [Pelolinea sp.]|nr:MBL fold metallo-hydrolase [Pelolinea sp.]
MKEIAPDILIETDYEGVTLGAIRTPVGVVMVDTPLNPKDSMAWRAICSRSAGGSDRLLVLLDEHTDRLSGASGMKCPIIVHERTAQSLTSRPSSSRAQAYGSSLDWEDIPEPVNTRGVHPEITFTSAMAINWGEEPILLEHHPGPSRGCTWVIAPEKQVAFIGDTVTPGQPPFMASADIDTWLVALHDLQLARFKDFILISGREDMVTSDDIKDLEKFLKKAGRKLDKLISSGVKADEAEKLGVEMTADFRARNKRESDQFKSRLALGFGQYFVSHISKKSD